MKLSVGIITFNEEKILSKTLSAVSNLADEIIIVDSHSTDSTVDIAKKFNAKVFTEKWKGFGKQKNSVIEKCSGEWILLIDADEVLSDRLIDKIKKIVWNEDNNSTMKIDNNNKVNDKNRSSDENKSSSPEVYDINRASVCFGKELKYGGWSNQYATRLWKNGTVRVSEVLVHEEFITDKAKGKLKEKIYHYTYPTMDGYFERFNKYTTLGAKEYFLKGKKTNNFNLIFNPIYKFIRMYIIRLGFLDGIEGFTIAITSAMYSFIKYFKLREMYRNNVYQENDTK